MDGIVDEIVVAVRPLIEGLTGFNKLKYEYNIALNADDDYEERYGFVPGNATFVEGSAMGFSTMDHTFNIKLTDDFRNRDCDDAQHKALMNLYAKVQGIVKELQKSRLALPTPTNRVLLISGLSFDDPEFSDDNNTVLLTANLIFKYRYKNN